MSTRRLSMKPEHPVPRCTLQLLTSPLPQFALHPRSNATLALLQASFTINKGFSNTSLNPGARHTASTTPAVQKRTMLCFHPPSVTSPLQI